MEIVKVSVLLPVYNGASTLAQAIESILCQSLSEFELLIIDDCSKDNSADLIRQYAKKDSRIKVVFHDVNIGLAKTLNEGLRLAKSDFVARMDQDDESLQNRLAVQLKYIHNYPETVVVGSFVYHMGAKKEFDRLVELPIESTQIKETLKQYNCMYHPSVIMRRNQVLELGGYKADFKNAEDYDLWLRVSKRYSLANIPEPLLRYRFSVTGMTLSRKWEQLFYVYLALAAYREEREPIEKISKVARVMLENMDRKYFLNQVATGTVTELVSLKLWKDAIDLVSCFYVDIGFKSSLRLISQIAKSFLMS